MTTSPQGRRPIQTSRTFLAERVLRPAQAFVHTEASGGIFLLAAAVVALIWANSPWDHYYFDLWERHLSLDTSLFVIDESLGHLVSDGLMTIFFFVVGLEIKREFVRGELASPRRAALPIVAAFGGMLVPALVYLAFNAGGDGSHGWGIPMATDIAFALGVLALLGPRVPFGLKIFLLALAIVDDLGAILVIAVFYTDQLSLEALAWAGVVLAGVLAAQKRGIYSIDFYVVLGIFFWMAVLKSGIHATLAGVILALVSPANPRWDSSNFPAESAQLGEQLRAARAAQDRDAEHAIFNHLESISRGYESPLDRLERVLHPWVSYLVVPIFALANAGLAIDGDFVRAAVESPVAIGTATGLVGGKVIGIFVATWLIVRFGFAALPEGVTWAHILGAAMLGGIGFTVSLFITGLAFDDPSMANEARAGVLAASAVAGLGGYLWLRVFTRPGPIEEPAKATGH